MRTEVPFRGGCLTDGKTAPEQDHRSATNAVDSGGREMGYQVAFTLRTLQRVSAAPIRTIVIGSGTIGESGG